MLFIDCGVRRRSRECKQVQLALNSSFQQHIFDKSHLVSTKYASDSSHDVMFQSGIYFCHLLFRLLIHSPDMTASPLILKMCYSSASASTSPITFSPSLRKDHTGYRKVKCFLCRYSRNCRNNDCFHTGFPNSSGLPLVKQSIKYPSRMFIVKEVLSSLCMHELQLNLIYF